MTARRWKLGRAVQGIILLTAWLWLAGCHRQPNGERGGPLFAEGELAPLPTEPPPTPTRPVSSTQPVPKTQPATSAVPDTRPAPPVQATQPVRPMPTEPAQPKTPEKTPEKTPAKAPAEFRADLSDEKARDQGKPISEAQGPVGDLLRKWYAEKTAAGNLGDYYDNRDRAHSPLDLKPFPQLSTAVYPDKFKNQNYGRMMFLLNHVTIGNSSTSGQRKGGGCHARGYYLDARSMDFLYQEYRNNNLYVYPAHQDYSYVDDPGDVLPANSPYLITSVGPSFTDLPFLQAVASTLAAFRPEVKKKLKETGLLMPTVQMILRASYQPVKTPKDYLTGAAHPAVFNGAGLDPLKMVQMAHDIQLNTIPPMIQLRVLEEDAPVLGKDYFDNGRTEVLADTPAAITRVWRGVAFKRRMVVSAENSYDINRKPLTYHWAVLRQSPGQVVVKPLNPAGSVVEILITYHVRNVSVSEAARVEVAAFAHNGSYYSAPGFVTWCFLENEQRTYDPAGRIQEIDYGVGRANLIVADWPGIFESIKPGNPGLAGHLWAKYVTAEEMAALRAVGGKYRAAGEPLFAARPKVKQAQEENQKAAAALRAADEQWRAAQAQHAKEPTRQTQEALDTAMARRTAAQEAQRKTASALQAVQPPATAIQAANAVLAQGPPVLLNSVRDGYFPALWGRMLGDTQLYTQNRDAIEAIYRAADEATRTRFDAARQRGINVGILKRDGAVLTVSPRRDGPGPLEQRLSPFEASQLSRFHAEVLVLVFGGMLNPTFIETKYTDSRLVIPGKTWRDVYKYDAAGNSLGWTRYGPDARQEFTAAGLLLVEKDNLGRPIKARTVQSFQLPSGRAVAGNEVLSYEYNGPRDFAGRIAKREVTEER